MIELAGLLVLGFLAQWFAWRVKVPAILPLIVIGLMVGPFSTFFTPDGAKFIDGDQIFHGELLFDVIAISVGLILFEGGLTLKLQEVRTLGTMVRNLIIVGTFVTLIGASIAANIIMGLDYRIATIFGSLIIVTGPTVIGPILRNVRPNMNISTILKWEGILIDPVGALVAILIYEFIVSGRPNEQFGFFAFKGFMLTILSGLVVGVVFAGLVYYILRRTLVPKYLLNIVMLALVILCFAVSDLLHKESGLLAVTVMGMILANVKLDSLKQILSFKEDVTLVLISFLFVLLSSRIDMRDITLLMNWRSALLFAVVVFVLRPITVFISAYRSHLTLREKLFISWISPRGIVSAGVASIFTIRLVDMPVEGIALSQALDATMILPLTFMMIVGTVVLQGLTAKPLAKALGVNRSEPNGVLFLGANSISRFLAKYLKTRGIPVLLADTSHANIVEAKSDWLPVYEGSLLRDETLEEVDLTAYGQLFAMTPNTEINILSCKMLKSEFGENRVFRLASIRELEMEDLSKPTNLLFLGNHGYSDLLKTFQKNPRIYTQAFKANDSLEDLLGQDSSPKFPLFILRKENRKVLPVTEKTEVEEGDQLIYVRPFSVAERSDQPTHEVGLTV